MAKYYTQFNRVAFKSHKEWSDAQRDGAPTTIITSTLAGT